MPQDELCNYCGELFDPDDGKSQECACHAAFYCSKAHMDADFDNHKTVHLALLHLALDAKDAAGGVVSRPALFGDADARALHLETFPAETTSSSTSSAAATMESVGARILTYGVRPTDASDPKNLAQEETYRDGSKILSVKDLADKLIEECTAVSGDNTTGGGGQQRRQRPYLEMFVLSCRLRSIAGVSKYFESANDTVDLLVSAIVKEYRARKSDPLKPIEGVIEDEDSRAVPFMNALTASVCALACSAFGVLVENYDANDAALLPPRLQGRKFSLKDAFDYLAYEREWLQSGSNSSGTGNSNKDSRIICREILADAQEHYRSRNRERGGGGGDLSLLQDADPDYIPLPTKEDVNTYIHGFKRLFILELAEKRRQRIRDLYKYSADQLEHVLEVRYLTDKTKKKNMKNKKNKKKTSEADQLAESGIIALLRPPERSTFSSITYMEFYFKNSKLTGHEFLKRFGAFFEESVTEHHMGVNDENVVADLESVIKQKRERLGTVEDVTATIVAVAEPEERTSDSGSSSESISPATTSTATAAAPVRIIDNDDGTTPPDDIYEFTDRWVFNMLLRRFVMSPSLYSLYDFDAVEKGKNKKKSNVANRRTATTGGTKMSKAAAGILGISPSSKKSTSSPPSAAITTSESMNIASSSDDPSRGTGDAGYDEGNEDGTKSLKQFYEIYGLCRKVARRAVDEAAQNVRSLQSEMESVYRKDKKYREGFDPRVVADMVCEESTRSPPTTTATASGEEEEQYNLSRWKELPFTWRPYLWRAYKLGRKLKRWVEQTRGNTTLKNDVALDLIRYFNEDPGQISLRQNRNIRVLGPAGTGKTTFCLMWTDVLRLTGEFPRPSYVMEQNIASRSTLVGRYKGESAPKTAAYISGCVGSVGMLDEAYSISYGPEDEYGMEALNTIVYEADRNKGLLCLIAAGYEEDMERQFFGLNQGLDRRFSRRFTTEILFPHDLYELFVERIKRDNYRFANDGVKMDPIAESYDYRKDSVAEVARRIIYAMWSLQMFERRNADGAIRLAELCIQYYSAVRLKNLSEADARIITHDMLIMAIIAFVPMKGDVTGIYEYTKSDREAQLLPKSPSDVQWLKKYFSDYQDVYQKYKAKYELQQPSPAPSTGGSTSIASLLSNSFL